MYCFWALYVIKDEKEHYLELDDATEISYEWLSPMWNTETSTTWDFSLPRTPYNEELLLPSSANGELIPLGEGRLQGYLTGLPWQETDEAYWGLLTVLSANERRIKVQFLQKSLFEQKLEVPVREIKVSIAHPHRVEALSSVWASGEAWVNGQACNKVVIAWQVKQLLVQIAQWCGYECINGLGNNGIYIVSNLYNSLQNAASKTVNVVNKPYIVEDIRENGRKYTGPFVTKGSFRGGDGSYSVPSSRLAIGLIRDLLRVYCGQFIVKEFVLGSEKKSSVKYLGANYTYRTPLYFGELSSYEWVKAPYPDIEDVASRYTQEMSSRERLCLIPIIVTEDDKDLSFREYTRGEDINVMPFCFYNNVIDGRPFDYSANCLGRFFYVDWTNEFPYYYAYYWLKDYENTVHLRSDSHLFDCRPSGVSVSSSQYSIDAESGTWKYLGEYLRRRNPHVHGRGTQRVSLPFQRCRFIGLTLEKKRVYTYGDTLLHSCDLVTQGGAYPNYHFAYYDRIYPLNAQSFGQGVALKDKIPECSATDLPRTRFTNLSTLKTYLSVRHKKDDPPHLPDEDDLPLPPQKDWDDDGRPKRPHRPWLRNIRSVSTFSESEDAKKKFQDKDVRLLDKQQLFYAFSAFYLNTEPPQPCIELDEYDPSKPRAERLFIVGLKRNNNLSEIQIHPTADKVLPFNISRIYPIEGRYFEESLTNDLPLDDLVLPYFQHLWHAVEGELTSWEEEEVFKYMTEFNYPSLNDTAHIGNQRIKRVTMVLRRNECRIKSVRVIQFNRVATKDEFNKFLQ